MTNLYFFYHKSCLLLLALKVIKLLVDNQLIPLPIRPKSISFEESCYKRSQVKKIAVTLLYCLRFSTSKDKGPKTDLEKYYKFSASFEFLWNSNFAFFW